jgi:hypothetical protein
MRSLVTEIVHVPFNGSEVLCVEIDGKPHVLLRPALDKLGLNYSAQHRKLQRRSWACVAQVTTQIPGDDQSRAYTATDVRTFLMLLATVDERQVAEVIRPALVEYQRRVADAIEEYWTKGHVAHPRWVTDEPKTLTWDEVVHLLGQRYGLEMTVSSLLSYLRSAGVLKQTSAPMKKYSHYFWHTGSTWNVHPHMLAALAVKVADVRHELIAFRTLQMQLELEGVNADARELDA